ncbi:MAG: helix-turn-helix domain-containing protein [Bacteroidota bacterium]
MKLHIKYMVSHRCKIMVRNELDKLGIHYTEVELGQVELKSNISAEQRSALKAALIKSGLDLIDDTRAIIIEKIKNIIVDMVHYSEEMPRINFSSYLSKKLLQDYGRLSTLFSEATGTTIEHFIIAHKIERVKEFLLYNELNLTEIASMLNYSSVAHLSNQFKKVTGLTPTFFKQLGENKRRIALEDV